jgi:hypothetical protein
MQHEPILPQHFDFATLDPRIKCEGDSNGLTTVLGSYAIALPLVGRGRGGETSFMLIFAMLAAGLFIGFTVTTAVRESAYAYYLRHYTAPGRARRIAAQIARVVAFLFAGLFYLCIAVAFCVLIALAFSFLGYAYELFIRA